VLIGSGPIAKFLLTGSYRSVPNFMLLNASII